MADNVNINTGSDLIVAADEAGGGAYHQWVKIEIGGDGSFVPVTTANGLPVQVLSLPPFPLVQVSGTTIAITSLPDLGLNSSVKITSLPSFAAGSSVTISNLASVPLTISGTTIAITSLPDLGLNSSVKITSLPDLGAGSVIKITSLPDLGLNSFVKISSLPGVVIISATNAVPVNVVAGGAGNGSILDGSNTAIKATVASYSNASPLLVRLSDTNGDYVAPGAASNITVSNLASVPLTISGTTIAITSLPDLGLNSSVKITSLPDLGAGSTVKITSLPDLGLNSSVKITSLPPLGAATVSINNFTFILSVTNAGVFPISSLPSLAFGQKVTITNGAILSISAGTIVSVTNLVSVLETVPTYRLKISTATPISGYWNVTRTYTAATTNSIIIPLSASTTAHHITDVVFSNGQTHGSFALLCSRSNAGLLSVIDRLIFRDYGGAVMNFSRPLVLDTNSALVFTSRTATDHSITVIGYTV